VSGFQVFRGILSARLTQISTGDLSLLARISLWRVAVRVIEHNFLFGVGANNFLNIKYQYGIPHWLDPTKAFNTHNLYLEILVNFGIIGFIGFFSLIAKTFKKLSDIIKTKEDNDISTLSLGLKAAILTFLIHGLIDCGLYLNMIFYSFMIIIGFSWAIIILSEKKSPNNKTGINLCRKNT
jgi:O-antigen ligase